MRPNADASEKRTCFGTVQLGLIQVADAAVVDCGVWCMVPTQHHKEQNIANGRYKTTV